MGTRAAEKPAQRGRSAILALVVALTAMFVVSGTLAPKSSEAITPAHVLGGWWTSTNPLNYTCRTEGSLHADWCDVVTAWGANSWQGANINLVRTNPSNARITVVISPENKFSAYGRAVFPSPGRGSARPYSTVRIDINRFHTDAAGGFHHRDWGGSASRGDKQCLLSHEFGHAIGLAHHATTYSIMTTYHDDRCGHGTKGGYGPAAHDNTDVWWLYNVYRT